MVSKVYRVYRAWSTGGLRGFAGLTGFRVALVEYESLGVGFALGPLEGQPRLCCFGCHYKG